MNASAPTPHRSYAPAATLPLTLELCPGRRADSGDKRLCYSPNCGCAAKNSAEGPRRAA
ncbi:hypothetical protein [Streptomyces sp. NPDC001568]|uniref:hypothetical protein n=1 Tax=Streptomyces sp. NPDC001568 TaxID=3364588 RepID=UPI00369B03FB